MKDREWNLVRTSYNPPDKSGPGSPDLWYKENTLEYESKSYTLWVVFLLLVLILVIILYEEAHMKLIRKSVFETNSSSCHVLVYHNIASRGFKKWEDELPFLDFYDDNFKKEVIEIPRPEGNPLTANSETSNKFVRVETSLGDLYTKAWVSDWDFISRVDYGIQCLIEFQDNPLEKITIAKTAICELNKILGFSKFVLHPRFIEYWGENADPDDEFEDYTLKFFVDDGVVNGLESIDDFLYFCFDEEALAYVEHNCATYVCGRIKSHD